MPAPTSYTDEADLAVYMLAILDAVGSDLQLNATPAVNAPLGHFTEAVNGTLLQYGTADIASITGTENIIKLRAIARVHAWRLAKTRASPLYNFSDGSQKLDRAAIFDHVVKQLAEAESDLAAIPGAGVPTVRISSIRWPQDPYGPFNPLASGDD